MAVETTLIERNFTVDTSRTPSPALWGSAGGCPRNAIREGGRGGTYIDHEFQDGGLITSPTTEAALVGIPLSGFGSAGSIIAYSDEYGGGLTLTAVNDNLATYIRVNACPFQVSASKGTLWFEARVKVGSITQLGMILGLWSNTTLTVDIPLSAANPPIMATTGDFIGFRMPEAAGVVNAVYDTNDSDQTVDAEVVVKATITTLVAATYVKLGMVFDPNDGNKLSYWVNNIKSSSQKVVPNDTATDFPATKRVGPLFGMKLAAAATLTSSIDWWKCYQLDV